MAPYAAFCFMYLFIFAGVYLSSVFLFGYMKSEDKVDKAEQGPPETLKFTIQPRYHLTFQGFYHHFNYYDKSGSSCNTIKLNWSLL